MNINKLTHATPAPTFAVIGCGRVGIALAAFLTRAGYTPAAFYSKTAGSAEKARIAAGKGVVCDTSAQAAQQADIVFITTPDLRIESVCNRIAQNGGFSEKNHVFHLSGALSSDILKAARLSRAHTGSIHPLQSFAPYLDGQKSPFSGINISIEGDASSVTLGEQIITALGARHFTIPTQSKTLYHAAAVVASNYLVTLEDFAIELLKQSNLPEEQAYGILEPLIQGTLNNIKTQGTIRALTGPVARGDVQVVSRHLADIDATIPRFSKLYKLLGRHTLAIAEKRGEISPDAVQSLSRLFNDADHDRS